MIDTNKRENSETIKSDLEVIEALTQDVQAWVEAVRAFGGIGVALYAACFLLASLMFVPASPMAAIAGFLYGPLWGALLVSLVGVVSAALAFAIGRTAARPWVRRRLQAHPRLAAVDTAVATGGFRIVFLLRLASIVPFAPLSYALGASRISGRSFVLASWLGLLPGSFLYVYLGSLVSDVGQILNGEAAGGDAARLLTWVGLAAAVLAVLTIARFARNAVHQSINPSTSRKLEHEQVI
ncbi:SNARE associated Golgi protein [Rhodoferax sp. OV413]|uniref:TVP38/TMEM64 family protein n=1 Tax=Rhodoferax sp. OV413 TaxID=1855285 RepID=UPI0008856623|nr:TVP38/TMEM64 family protein [Rhodoferax sp. OV413]SDO80137.1 SNARE associated Golgi protein [Rhodoferax sp. OV413]